MLNAKKATNYQWWPWKQVFYLSGEETNHFMLYSRKKWELKKIKIKIMKIDNVFKELYGEVY